MRELPHAAGYTLNADAFMRADEIVGFSIANQPATVFSHFHDFYELALVVSGAGSHVTGVGAQRIQRGSAIFVAPGASHGYELGEGLVVYNCFLRVEAARYDLSWAHRDARLGRLFQAEVGGVRVPTVVSLDAPEFQECVAHLDAVRTRAPADRSEAFDMGHLLLTLDILARQVEQDHRVPTTADPAAPGVVRAAVGLIMRDLRVHWTLAELSRELSLDPYHLVKLFGRWVGSPPIAYANERRAERAATLLANTDDPVAVVGATVGWPEPAHFSRRFRAAMGVSPRAFRADSRQRRPGSRETDVTAGSTTTASAARTS